MQHVDLVAEAGRQGQTAEGTTDHWAEADSPTEAQAVTEVAATAEAPHKTATTEDHQDTAQHLKDTRSATLLHPYLNQK